MEEIVSLLTKLNKTISTMESCTGGGIVNAITNIPGASEVLKFSAVTYSNEYKIKMGVSEDIINKYTVYSMEVADAMSKNIAMYSVSNYGIGVTGQLNRKDPHNNTSEMDKVYISIYDKDKDVYYNKVYTCEYVNRIDNKNEVISLVIEMLKSIISD